ncbi:hypothetical protein J6590_075199 [Homalodisca vitripennis]|nr:hypothetical protein J6590_075199 [Homalodisca vitripennis]
MRDTLLNKQVNNYSPETYYKQSDYNIPLDPEGECVTCVGQTGRVTDKYQRACKIDPNTVCLQSTIIQGDLINFQGLNASIGLDFTVVNIVDEGVL